MLSFARTATTCGALLGSAALSLLACQRGSSHDEMPADGSLAMSGARAHWVDTRADDALLDMRVDVGTLRTTDGGHTVDFEAEWPDAPGWRADWLASHRASPALSAGARRFDRERVECRPEGPVGYTLGTRVVDQDGREVARESYDVATVRARAEHLNELLGTSYEGCVNHYCLACLAAASRCRGETLEWPAPKSSSKAEAAKRFVPSCP